MKILVIGGTGFIGRPLVRELARMGNSVAIFHRGQAVAYTQSIDSIRTFSTIQPRMLRQRRAV